MNQRGSKFIAVAQIAEAILPVARGEKYEDPLDAALKRAGLGSVNGGGSLLGAQRHVESVDVEITLRDLDGALQFARATLLALGAPGGSLILFVRDGRPRALAIATGQEFDHQPALDALERRMALAEVDDEEEEEERQRVEAAAKRLLKAFEGLWAGTHEYPPADLSTYSADWLEWYDEVAQALASHGFESVGDIATVRTDLPERKVYGFSRKFLDGSGITRVDAFRVATAEPRPPVQGMVFKSEFEDGRYLSTSNLARKWNSPDFIDAEALPPESPVEAIADRHAVRLGAYRAANSAAAMRLTSLTELLAAEERERERTRSFRRAQGIPSREELERLGAAPDFAARVYEEIRRLKAMD